MKNNVVFAAAGNGKTYNICKKAKDIVSNSNKYVLIISYTNEGVLSIENEYRKQNHGILDEKIIVKTWYSFLLTELIKPYQCLIKLNYKNYNRTIPITVPENFISSIAFYDDGPISRTYKDSHIQYYLNESKDIHKDLVSKLSNLIIKDSKSKSIQRLEEIYSNIFIDELQDYAGYDLDIFLHLFKSKINITCVGDYKQATFRTNNSLRYKQYRDEKIANFFIEQEKKKVCNVSYDKISRRFNQEICDYVNTIHNDLENEIEPNVELLDPSIENQGVFIIKESDIKLLCDFYHPIILRYNKVTKVPFTHRCEVYNFGSSKGCTFDRVIILGTKDILSFITKGTLISSNQTKSKYFVACTRAKYSIFFVMKNLKINNTNFTPTDIVVNGNTIKTLKFN